MLVVKTVPTTSRIDELIYKVAASTKVENRGYLKYSKQGGETFVYDGSDESVELGREYFENLWGAAQHAVTGVKLEAPERRPTVLRLVKGPIVIPRQDVGVLIPIRSPDDTFAEVDIDVKSGDEHYNTSLAPHTIIVAFGEVSDVSIEIPVLFDLILHPKSRSTVPEDSAT